MRSISLTTDFYLEYIKTLTTKKKETPLNTGKRFEQILHQKRCMMANKHMKRSLREMQINTITDSPTYLLE